MDFDKDEAGILNFSLNSQIYKFKGANFDIKLGGKVIDIVEGGKGPLCKKVTFKGFEATVEIYLPGNMTVEDLIGLSGLHWVAEENNGRITTATEVFVAGEIPFNTEESIAKVTFKSLKKGQQTAKG